MGNENDSQNFRRQLERIFQLVKFDSCLHNALVLVVEFVQDTVKDDCFDGQSLQ